MTHPEHVRHWERRIKEAPDPIHVLQECVTEALAAKDGDGVEAIRKIGFSLSNFHRDEINDAIHSTAGASKRKRGRVESGLEVRCLTDVVARPVEWLWNQRIALGKVTTLAGDGGMGKSTILCDIAARVSNGDNWPDGKANDGCGNVIILAAEDSVEDTIKPRLAAARADMTRVFSIAAVKEEKTGLRRTFNLQADLDRLRHEIERIGNVRLIVIDPISSYLGKIDSHKNADVRSVLEPLGLLANESGAAILCNNHFSKGSGGANSRVIGSVAFINQSRAAFIVSPDAENDGRRLFLPSKMNLAALGEGLAYRIGSFTADCDGISIATSQICWESDAVSVSADAALAALAERGEGGSALDEAREFLRDTLAAGPVAANELKQLARDAGIAWATLRRAQPGLAESKPSGPVGAKDRWKWSLAPKALIETQGAHPQGMSILAPNEHLSEPDPADEYQFNREDDPLAIPAILDRRHEAAR